MNTLKTIGKWALIIVGGLIGIMFVGRVARNTLYDRDAQKALAGGNVARRFGNTRVAKLARRARDLLRPPIAFDLDTASTNLPNDLRASLPMSEVQRRYLQQVRGH